MGENSKIFTDENGQFQFDFVKALEVHRIHEYYQRVAGSLLSDVDYILEREKDYLFIEYKNCDIPNAANPEAYYKKLKEDNHYIKIARKYYDSLLFVLALGKIKPVRYVYILECQKAAATERKMIREKIMMKLPFALQRNPVFQNPWIDEFQVCSIEEWNQNFPDFLVSPIADKP